MNDTPAPQSSSSPTHDVRKPRSGRGGGWRWIFLPLLVLLWPLIWFWRVLDRNWVAYLTGRVSRDRGRIYSVKFVWYGDTVYLHPMIWGSLLFAWFHKQDWVAASWLLLAWFSLLTVCFLAIMYNFNVIRVAILGVCLVAMFGMVYVSTVEFKWNPFHAFAHHIQSLDATVSWGFYVVSCYIFAAMIGAEVIWAWLFHRVEIDESYVYEHQFLSTSTREPIFARGLRRETKDLLELLLLGAGDIRHRTRTGYKRFKNVPFASLWLGTALDAMLDHPRMGEITEGRTDDEAEDARVEDAMGDGHDHDDHDDDHDHDDDYN